MARERPKTAQEKTRTGRRRLPRPSPTAAAAAAATAAPAADDATSPPPSPPEASSSSTPPGRRSKRVSIKPLKFWANERITWDRGDASELRDGKTKIVLPVAEHVNRVVEAPARPRPGRGRPAARSSVKKHPGKTARRRAGEREPSSQDDEGLPPREERTIITGNVVSWDPRHHGGAPEAEADDDADDDADTADRRALLAVPAGAATLALVDRGAKGFRFARFVSTPFMNAGIVELAPGAEKTPKNTRNFHISGFVFTGRVRVTVAQNEFICGPGSQFFVPRGNYYSLKNLGHKPARLGYSSACDVSSSTADRTTVDTRAE